MNSRNRKRHTARKCLRLVVMLAVLALAAGVLARVCLHYRASGRIYARVSDLPKCRVALVLGAGVRPNGKLSPLLKDRVDAGIRLYEAGKVEKLLMSGDNRVSHYNEPKRMCDYAIAHGVPAEDVAMDFAGRRTYDSIYRAKHIFGLKGFVVVTQRFHLDRTLFLCDHVGVECRGFAADVPGRNQMRAEVRELGASLGALVDVYLREPRPAMGKRERV